MQSAGYVAEAVRSDGSNARRTLTLCGQFRTAPWLTQLMIVWI